MKFEICSGSIESCIAASEAGADRVELCSALSEGGLTPSYAVVEYACNNLSIDVNVLIRPRGGDFVYSPLEISIMKRDIQIFSKLGVKGIVIGCLTDTGSVDMHSMRELISAKGDMSVTFHRAFDVCLDWRQSLEDIIALGCDRILTSGQNSTAYQGIPLLKELNNLSAGRIIIMPGCGVSIKNIEQIISQTNVTEIHFSASKPRISNYSVRNEKVDFGANPSVSDFDLISKMIDLSKSI